MEFLVLCESNAIIYYDEIRKCGQTLTNSSEEVSPRGWQLGICSDVNKSADNQSLEKIHTYKAILQR